MSAARARSQAMAGVLTTVLTMALGLVLLSTPPAAQAQAVAIPVAEREAAQVQARIEQFYAWYLAALQRNGDPLSDDRSALAQRVSARLLREIQRRLDSPDGMEADYFLQAQDYDDQWIGHVRVGAIKTGARQARAMVDLGSHPETRHRLQLSLVREDGLWKISQVARRR